MGTWSIRNLIHRLFGQTWQLELKSEQGLFELGISLDGKVTSLKKTITKPDLAQLKDLTAAKNGKTVVPPAKLSEFLSFSERVDGLTVNFIISPEIASLKRTDVPKDFIVWFEWSDQHQRIIANLGNDATYAGDGWFIGTDRYWHVPGLSSIDDLWFRCPEGNRNIELFFKSFVPTWKDRGLPFSTDLEYCETPAMKICVKSVEPSKIELETTWSMPPKHITSLQSFPEHVLCGRTIVPGLLPDNFPDWMQKDDVVVLSDENVPNFMNRIWPRIRKWAEGDITALEQLHQIHREHEFLLRVERNEHRGIGVLRAVSKVRVGEFEVDAIEIYRQFGVKRYFRIGNGWLPIRAGGIGLPELRSRKLSFRLTTKEILNRKSNRFIGPWSRIDFSVVDQFIDQRLAHDDAISHIKWLIALGISGGLVGSIEMTGDFFLKSLAQLRQNYPKISILVVGSKKTQNLSGLIALVSDNFGGESKGIEFLSPKDFEATSLTSNRRWDVLCVLEADRFVRSTRSKIFHAMRSCPKRLFITQFSKSDFLNRKSGREAWSQLFRIDDNSSWAQCLFHLNHSSSESFCDTVANDPNSDNILLRPTSAANTAETVDLPSNSPVENKHAKALDTKVVEPVEFTIGGKDEVSSFPVPPREESFSHNELETLSIRNPFATHETGFYEKARKLAAYKETTADFHPFMCYWPTYDSMDEVQRRWYFYWRGQVRERRYPDTDLSYIFIHVYELINNIGTLDTRDGYNQLRRLWHSYRGRHPKLDRYLTDWIFDYVLFYSCSIDPIQFLREATELGASLSDPDLVLPWYIEAGLENLPVSFMERYTNYRIQQSRFYIVGNQNLIQEIVPKSLARVNSYMEREEGEGIFDIFKPDEIPAQERSPFHSALHEFRGDLITIPAKIPYSQYGPLREFVTSVIKHTENRLRQKKSFSGKLTRIDLAKDLQIIIDELISESISYICPPLPKPVVRIDFGKVSRLAKESDEVREMLLQSATQEPTLSTPSPEIGTDEVGASGNYIDRKPLNSGVESETLGLHEAWEEFVSRLSDFQLEALTAILQGSEVIDKITQIADRNLFMPEHLIDMINELALETTGDIIIVPGSNPPEIEEESLDQVKQAVQIRR